MNINDLSPSRRDAYITKYALQSEFAVNILYHAVLWHSNDVSTVIVLRDAIVRVRADWTQFIKDAENEKAYGVLSMSTTRVLLPPLLVMWSIVTVNVTSYVPITYPPTQCRCLPRIRLSAKCVGGILWHRV